MTLIDMLDTVKDWAEREISPKLKFKKEPKTDEPNMEDYDHDTGHPKVFINYRPTTDTPESLPYDTPCMVIQLIECTIDRKNKEMEARIRVMCVTWSPGEYTPDTYDRVTGKTELNELGIYRQRSGKVFRVDDDGWRDSYIMADCVLNKLQSISKIGKLIIDDSKPVDATPYSEEEVLQYFYPESFMKVDFWVKSPVTHVHEADGRRFL